MKRTALVKVIRNEILLKMRESQAGEGEKLAEGLADGILLLLQDLGVIIEPLRESSVA